MKVKFSFPLTQRWYRANLLSGSGLFVPGLFVPGLFVPGLSVPRDFLKFSLLAFLFFSLSACGKNGSSKNADNFPTFADVTECPNGFATSANTGLEQFVRKEQVLGLIDAHGFTSETWGLEQDVNRLEQVMQAGGISAAYINGDCWADIIFASGDAHGMLIYLNKGEQKGFKEDSVLMSGTQSASLYKLFTGAAVADLNGDYRRELLLGNLLAGSIVILSTEKIGDLFYESDRLPVTRTTFGISFGDINGDGFLDMYAAHWDYEQVTAGAPVLWFNNGNGVLTPFDNQAGLAFSSFDQQYNFTAQFADIRNSGVQDIVLASDFTTSAVLQNDGHGVFTDVTDKAVIVDQFGMGSALGDINNNGKLDWFVSSVYTLNEQFNTEFVKGSTGNRLYKNVSNKNEIIFSDITEIANVKDGGWGWGSCMADFNHDGFLDIFHANGYGYIPDYVEDYQDVGEEFSRKKWYQVDLAEFTQTIPRLFINNGNGTFNDATAAWGLDVPSEGRGVICFDYDRDGDIDIALVDHSTGIQFFENQIGHNQGKRFLNIRVVGEAPNTDAIGTKIYLKADVGGGFGQQTQMRVSQANSNFNSQNLPDIHFGVGQSLTVASLRIVWPDSSGLLCQNVKTNQFLVFDQRDKTWPKKDENFPDCTWHENIHSV